MLNIVVVSPMPIVRANTATTLRPGLLRSARAPYRTSRAIADIGACGEGGRPAATFDSCLRRRGKRGFTTARLRHISQMGTGAGQANVPVWASVATNSDERGLSFPGLTSSVDAAFCVIGLGGSGLACIGELLTAGVPASRIVGIDAGAVASGAAGRNGGFLLAGTAAFYHDAV